MDELLDLIETMSEEDLDLVIDKIKERIVLPFYLLKEDVSYCFEEMVSMKDEYKGRKVYPLLFRYNEISPEERSILLDDIVKFLSWKNETELDNRQIWSYFIERLFFELEDFDEEMRDRKIDLLIG